MHIFSQFKKITTFIFDMDGVLTDGQLLLSGKNEWLRSMSIKDGYALQAATSAGYNIMVLSGSNSEPVSIRLKKLGVTHIYMGVKDKKDFLENFLLEKKWIPGEILYMGDDLPDLECMKMVSIAACPIDAVDDVRAIAAYISPYSGGKGCVRDVIEKVMKLNGKWNPAAQIPSI
ncbi:MAG: 3-deoxy-D-manno-octulosonate 8-phosphate phosphatase [Ginsengibacter sp.]